MKIYFATHATSLDNELHISSGWKDVGLSPLGEKQAHKMGKTFKFIPLNLIFCSDLKRAYNTVQIAFNNKIPITKDKRLRELNYGDYNGKPSEIVGPDKKNHIKKPFSGGESYEQAIKRVHEFLKEILKKYPNKTILVVGHRATHYGIDTFTGKRTLEECVNEKFVWQPYWEYKL